MSRTLNKMRQCLARTRTLADKVLDEEQTKRAGLSATIENLSEQIDESKKRTTEAFDLVKQLEAKS